MAKDEDPAGVVGQLLTHENLALLRKGDRLVILAAGLVVVAALGGIAVLRENAPLATVLAVSSMLIVAGLVALVQWRALSFGDLESEIADQSAAAQAVNGDWWQVVRDDDHPGLTYVAIRIAPVAERHAMHGITFDSEGRRVARWSTDAVAIRSSTPVELYYVWRGTAYLQDGSQLVSGLGRFRFDSVGREERPLDGEGAFTRGSTVEMQFGPARGVELTRLSAAEAQRLQADPSCLAQLAREAYATLGLDEQRTLLRP
jgi:hypothetical protein